MKVVFWKNLRDAAKIFWGCTSQDEF